MCKELCEDYGGKSCQDCGKLICFDVKHGDDILRPAYVTESGDLFCDRCGPAYDEEERYDRFDELSDHYADEMEG